MTGTGSDIIAIVIVPVVVLAFWLGMMFHVSSHPQWRHQAQADDAATRAPEVGVPPQRPVSPGGAESREQLRG
jgi:hypothetical protein